MGLALSKMQIKSSAFEALGTIPRKHTGEGENISPPLEWTNVPEGTKAFALICHDPDAPLVLSGRYGFVHWVLYNIPNSTTFIPEGVDDYTKGVNDAQKKGYMGPKPPEGHGTHHYFFWILALNEELNLKEGLTLWQLLEEIEPYLIGMNRIVCKYSR